MIVRAVDKHPREVEPGMWRTVLSYGERLMVVEVALNEGARVPAHQHPHEQISYIVRGTLQFTLDGQQVVLSTGESCLIRPGVIHAVEALTDCTALDAFSPPRQDFL